MARLYVVDVAMGQMFVPNAMVPVILSRNPSLIKGRKSPVHYALVAGIANYVTARKTIHFHVFLRKR